MRRKNIPNARAGSPVSQAHYRIALGVAILLVAAALELIPFAGRTVSAAPALQTSFVTAALCLSAITAYVVLAQFAVTRSLALLLLGSGYWFATLMAVPFLFAFVGVDLGPLSTLIASPWLWVCGHAGFSLLALGYLVARARDRHVGNHGTAGRLALMISACVAVASALLIQALMMMPHMLPNPDMRITAPALALLSACGVLVALLVLRLGSVLDTWLAVALLASLLDVLFSANSAGAQNTVGWYVGFFDRIFVSLFVLTAFLGELTTGSARLATLASIDALTGLPNRRGLDERLERELDGGRRRNDDLSVLMIDIDYFKDYNDRFGHAVGDEALRIVAKVIDRGLARTRDFAARYGGEEFAVVLPDTDHDGALLVAERIRAGVARATIGHQVPAQIGTRVTVSVGVAAVGRRDIFDAASILEAADRALYAAKESGRNCIRDAKVGIRRRDEGVRTA